VAIEAGAGLVICLQEVRARALHERAARDVLLAPGTVVNGMAAVALSDAAIVKSNRSPLQPEQEDQGHQAYQDGLRSLHLILKEIHRMRIGCQNTGSRFANAQVKRILT
jgi:hypothetical protein